MLLINKLYTGNKVLYDNHQVKKCKNDFSVCPPCMLQLLQYIAYNFNNFKSYCVSTVCCLMLMPVVPHTSGGTVRHSCHIPPYHDCHMGKIGLVMGT